MDCGYGEKLILYFYGEADAGLKAGVETHLAACSGCRAELVALKAASGWLSARAEGPSAYAVRAVAGAARAAVRRAAPGFRLSWNEALLGLGLAALMAGIFAFSGKPAGARLAWNSGVDSRLDSVEYSVCRAQSEQFTASSDWDYNYSALEDEGELAQKNV
jgi:anti-sigma factor RsiW